MSLTAINFPSGPETRTYFGCTITGIRGYTQSNGMRFVYIGFKQIKTCKESGASNFWKNMDKGNSRLTEETKRLDAGETGCTSKRAGQINKFFQGIWDESSKKTNCSGTVKPGNYLGTPCKDYKWAAIRAVKSSTGKNGKEYNEDCKNKLKACTEKKTGCGTVKNRESQNPILGTDYTENGVITARSCDTNHMVGRAADIMNFAPPVPGVTAEYSFPDNKHEFTINTCAYKLWNYYAENAHRYYIASLGREWWHWQFFGTDKVDKDAIPEVTSENPSSTKDETGTSSDTTIIEKDATSETENDTGTPLEIPPEDEIIYVDANQVEYSSIEAVDQELPTLDPGRYTNTQLVGSVYLSDDLDLLVLNRLKEANNVTNTVNQQGQITPASSESSRWNDVKKTEDTDVAKKSQQKLNDLNTQKTDLENQVNALETIIEKYSVSINGGLGQEGISNENVNPNLYENFEKFGETASNLKQTVSSILSSGEPPEQTINKINEEKEKLKSKISDLEFQEIPAAEKELQSIIGEIESARTSVENRVANLVSGFNGGIPPLNNLSNKIDDTFRLFNEGENALKEPTKVKINILPKIGDLTTLLAGGIKLQNFLSSLSSFGLPGIEELDKVKEMADKAREDLQNELSGIQNELGDLATSDALQSFQDLKNLKEKAGSIIQEGKDLYEKGNQLKQQIDSKVKEAQTALDTAKSLAKDVSDKLKSTGQDLLNQANVLYEQAKSLPSNLAKDVIDKANALKSEAESKINEAKKSYDDAINSANKDYEKIKGEVSNLQNQYDNVQNDPKLQQSKALQAKLDDVQSRVDSITSTVSPEISSKLEKAAEYKNTSEVLTNKAATLQKNLQSNVKSGAVNIQVKKHNPKDFKPFSEWVLDTNNELPPTSTEPSFVIYRGPNGKVKEPDFRRMKDDTYKNYGNSRYPTKYKSFCDFGKSGDTVVNLNKLFAGYTNKIISPIDVAILLNAGNVGMFNNTVPYGFGEGSELAAPVTFQNTPYAQSLGALFSKGGVGIKRDPNWSYLPEWAGLYANFLLEKNGIYQSDTDFMDLTFVKRIEAKYLNGNGIRLKNTSPITDIPKNYPGAVICYYNKANRKGHIEILLRVTLGGFLTIGGNVKIEGASKVGTTHGFKFYTSLKDFSPNDDVMIISRGKKNSWLTNGRLDNRIKRTEIIDEYMRSIENTSDPKNSKLLAGAYTLLKPHLSDIVYTRDVEKKSILTKDSRGYLPDESFNIHNEYNSYISGSRPLELDYPIVVKSNDSSGGH